MTTSRFERDPIGRLFAQVTAKLEDACIVAVDGQNPHLAVSRRKVLLRRILRMLNQAEGLIAHSLGDRSSGTGAGP